MATEPADLTSPPDGSQFTCILLEITPAVTGRTHICNWLLCHDVIKRVRSHVIVVVSPPPGEETLGFSAFRSAMKAMYTVLWDAARVMSKMHLQFTVLGDVPDHGLVVHTALRTLPRVSAVVVHPTASRLVSRQATIRSEWLGASTGPSTAPWHSWKHIDVAVPRDVIVADFEGEELPVFRKVCLGGTFDRLHSGHRQLLTYAAAVCSTELVVGVTGDDMAAAKRASGGHAPDIARAVDRIRGVETFVAGIQPSLRVRAVPISDPFGPSIEEPDIDALVVSSETLQGGLAVNRRRAERGLSTLPLVVINRFESHSLSSSFLRAAIPTPVPQQAE